MEKVKKKVRGVYIVLTPQFTKHFVKSLDFTVCGSKVLDALNVFV